MTLLESLQAALSIEQQVVYGYGVLGAHVSGPLEGFTSDCLTEHMTRRDALDGLVQAAGGRPVTAAPAYQLPFRVTNMATARRLAIRLEQASAGAAWDLIATSSAGSGPRSAAIGWLTDSAIRLERWGAELALPGQPA